MDFAVQSLVDIFFSFALAQSKWIPQVLDHYIELLLCDDANVSHAAKAALQRSMRATHKATHRAEQRNDSPPPPPDDDDDIMRLAIAMSLEGSEGLAPAADESDRFRKLRLALMVRLTDDLPELKKKGGVKSIHFLQVRYHFRQGSD